MKRLLHLMAATSAAHALFLSALFAQSADTRAKATDWEEINFEFNQAVLVDGFPGMLRLAELLKQHADYKVSLVGNSDQIGGPRVNDALSLKRAEAVSRFLQHYGATAGQIQVRGDGKRNPEAPGRDPNSRFMNRRVLITVTAPDGSNIGDGSLTAAVNDFEKYARTQLSKLDNILTQLQDLESQVRALKADTAGIKQDTAQVAQDTTQIKQDTGAIHTDTQDLVKRPSPLTAEQTTEIARAEAQKAADDALREAALRNQKYGLVGVAAGPTFGGGRTGVLSADLYGRALIPFANGKTPDQPGTHALQVDGDWTHARKRSARPDGITDGIFDIGLVNRFGRVQMGAFAQFDYVTLNSYQGSALLGSGILTLDYVFRGGSFGVFGAKGFREYANVGTSYLPGVQPTQALLRYEDQLGFHSIGAIGSRVFVESAAAFKRRYNPASSRSPSSFLKVGFALTDSIALYVQGDQNPTFQNISSGQRVVFGIQFGNWPRPSQYGQNPGVLPVDVPRPHYELLVR